MKRVLIITYYWPPNGGAGVQRWLRFAKYLPKHGWQPVIFTPENPEIVAPDTALLNEVPAEAEVIKFPIREPYGLYKRFTGRKKKDRIHAGFLNEKKRRGWREDLALWIRSNCFIPDARIGWVKPSVKFLEKYLIKNPVDVVVTTGPPHSMHLIGLALKRTRGVKWVADLRDPWTNIDFYEQLTLTKGADRKHHALQNDVLTNADKVIAVGNTLAGELKDLGGNDVHVIMNGHDIDPSGKSTSIEQFTLVHVGSLTSTRNAPQLWSALATMCKSDRVLNEQLRLHFVGPVDETVLESIAEVGLEDRIVLHGQLTHALALEAMKKADVLLLLLNDTANAKGILTSKLFEYLAVSRPILGIGPLDGDVACILKAPHVLIDRGSETTHQDRIRSLFGISSSVLPQADEHSRAHRCVELVKHVLDPLVKG